jgi:hypothetical protein
VLARSRWFGAPDIPTSDELGVPGAELRGRIAAVIAKERNVYSQPLLARNCHDPLRGCVRAR